MGQQSITVSSPGDRQGKVGGRRGRVGGGERESGEWVGGGGSGGTKSFAAVTSQSILQLNGVDDACVGRGNVGAGGGRAV